MALGGLLTLGIGGGEPSAFPMLTGLSASASSAPVTAVGMSGAFRRTRERHQWRELEVVQSAGTTIRLRINLQTGEDPFS